MSSAKKTCSRLSNVRCCVDVVGQWRLACVNVVRMKFEFVEERMMSMSNGVLVCVGCVSSRLKIYLRVNETSCSKMELLMFL